jgi:hypothetical protein
MRTNKKTACSCSTSGRLAVDDDDDVAGDDDADERDSFNRRHHNTQCRLLRCDDCLVKQNSEFEKQ